MTMKTRKMSGGSRIWAGFLGLSLMAGSAGAALSQEISLRVADSFPEHHYVSKQLIVPWMNRVEELTDGKVSFEYFPSESLARLRDLLDASRNRIADITYAPPLLISERLPLSGVVALPGVSGTAKQKSAAYQQLVDDILAAEEFAREDVMPLIAVTVAGYELNMIGPRLDSAEALQGKRMRSSGGLQENTVTAMGGVPITISSPEVYGALQRGTVDGTITPLASVKPWGFHEVLKSITTNADLGTFPITYVINAEVWNGLPEDVQMAMRKASLEVNATFGAYVDEQTAASEKELRELGIDLYELSDEALAEFSTRTQVVGKEWADGLEARGWPAQKVLEAWKAMIN